MLTTPARTRTGGFRSRPEALPRGNEPGRSRRARGDHRRTGRAGRLHRDRRDPRDGCAPVAARLRQHSQQVGRALLKNGLFGVNALAHDDLAMADAFSGRSGIFGAERFATGTWVPSPSGAPLLLSSLVSFECRLSDARIVATHHVLIGEIVHYPPRRRQAGAGLSRTGIPGAVMGAATCRLKYLRVEFRAFCRAGRGSSRSAARSRRGRQRRGGGGGGGRGCRACLMRLAPPPASQTWSSPAFDPGEGFDGAEGADGAQHIVDILRPVDVCAARR